MSMSNIEKIFSFLSCLCLRSAALQLPVNGSMSRMCSFTVSSRNVLLRFLPVSPELKPERD
ncbi:hypothetical protein KP509_23G037100 [Ceratopteris richardii]|uniref:Uncharacterized protein n=1 Tax=Ceratopteris richardii TaxID=49495 RepID=A0A8T2RZD5_CERRI|nr:hypothetical protein KP509_23G037100 [Ceratopteris richardii]